MQFKILSVVGARPNFIKVAPIHHALSAYSDIEHIICHTGQHFDSRMSDVFFNELGLPVPDYNLEISGGSHADQTARIMIAFEEVMLETEPDIVLVVGDVNSTLACSLVAAKLEVKVVHVEAGLRSFDRSMPEEINRMVTDVISDMLFVTEESGLKNLLKEGKSKEQIFFTGNVMIDSLVRLQPKFEMSQIFSELKVTPCEYVLCTFHRPANVDSKEFLLELQAVLNKIAEKNTIVFPIHPRTKFNLENWEMIKGFSDRVLLTDPIGYIDFLALAGKAKLIITDSGGIQEESTFMGIQCITVRDNTERPVTVDIGTNQLLGRDLQKVSEAALAVLDGKIKKGAIPELWDGKAAERIAAILHTELLKSN
ncbi:MAG TPA: UDP-N-acetylglucosamine 2-epimerase (non-hydrolyzing) [Flavobacteriales bacterium]|nr:UDP-N-acetylglucosamine 2-epimerase (non-hydrolyzing) [Flavobacteriales bacterium]